MIVASLTGLGVDSRAGQFWGESFLYARQLVSDAWAAWVSASLPSAVTSIGSSAIVLLYVRSLTVILVERLVREEREARGHRVRAGHELELDHRPDRLTVDDQRHAVAALRLEAHRGRARRELPVAVVLLDDLVVRVHGLGAELVRGVDGAGGRIGRRHDDVGDRRRGERGLERFRDQQCAAAATDRPVRDGCVDVAALQGLEVALHGEVAAGDLGRGRLGRRGDDDGGVDGDRPVAVHDDVAQDRGEHHDDSAHDPDGAAQLPPRPLHLLLGGRETSCHGLVDGDAADRLGHDQGGHHRVGDVRPREVAALVWRRERRGCCRSLLRRPARADLVPRRGGHRERARLAGRTGGSRSRRPRCRGR